MHGRAKEPAVQLSSSLRDTPCICTRHPRSHRRYRACCAAAAGLTTAKCRQARHRALLPASEGLGLACQIMILLVSLLLSSVQQRALRLFCQLQGQALRGQQIGSTNSCATAKRTRRLSGRGRGATTCCMPCLPLPAMCLHSMHRPAPSLVLELLSCWAV